jgi:hypothetical protein
MSFSRKAFEFTLILPSVGELTDQLTDALYESGCDDALVGCQNGMLFLDFRRDADSMESAVQSAIADVQSAGIATTNIRVEPESVTNNIRF